MIVTLPGRDCRALCGGVDERGEFRGSSQGRDLAEGYPPDARYLPLIRADGRRAGQGTQDVDAVDVLHHLAAFGEILDQDGERGGQYLDRLVREHDGGDDLAVQPGFLPDLTQHGLHRVLVRVNVAAGR